MATSVIYQADEENNAETWWTALREALPSIRDTDPEVFELVRQLERHGSVEICDPKAIERFDAFVHSLPGFSDGPDYARDALVVQAL